jgi:ubiquinone/menaquinone biosynthesis C-methylase UbiE
MRTDQGDTWQGDFGREYTDRNPVDVDELNAHYTRNFGETRTQLNESILGPLDKSLNVLEVGSNVGAQLLALQANGFVNMCGVELQRYAIEKAQSALPETPFVQASALSLPFEDDSFDLVFTSASLSTSAGTSRPGIG